MLRKKFKEYLLLLAALAIFIVGACVALFFADFSRPDFELGVNFSKSYAEYLGLDWRKTYLAILDDLKVKNIRLSAPWNEIEPQRSAFDFKNFDWQIEEAEKRGVNVVLVVGRRTPHWPECHDPEWIKNLPQEFVETRQMKMMTTVVERYLTSKSVKIWQVENEPLLDVFGNCPRSDLNLLRREIAMVKTMDSRPILVTDSGELSLWLMAANVGDLFGTTLYRVTYNPSIGYFYYYLPASFYRIKAWLVGQPPDKIYVAELQAEPWAPAGVLNSSLAEQKKSMDAARLLNHVSFAEKTGFRGAFLWGVEWWYWLKEKNNDDSLWQAGKIMFKE